MVKRKIIWSLRAKEDLFEILDFYYKRNGTKTFSINLHSDFRKNIKILEKHPEIGLKTDIENVRNLIDGNFSIFYEITVNEIHILSVWDNRQDLEKLQLK